MNGRLYKTNKMTAVRGDEVAFTGSETPLPLTPRDQGLESTGIHLALCLS